MSIPSEWPLSDKATRFVFSRQDIIAFSEDKLCLDLFPLAFGYYPLAKGHNMVRPEHDDHLMIYCVEGEGEVQRNGATQRVIGGDLVLLPKGISHAYSSSTQSPWSIFWIHFDGQRSSDWLNRFEFSGDWGVRHLGRIQSLILDFERLMALRLGGMNEAQRLNASAMLRQILAFVVAQLKTRQISRQGTLNLDEIHAFMQRNLTRTLTLQQLADEFHLSRYYFAQQYKAHTGHSPISQFMRFKVERACYLLDTTACSVSEIADQLGYDDPYYFSRVFSKLMGVSPTGFRRDKLVR